MILRPCLEDLKIIGFYLGKIIIGLALTMCIPLILGRLFFEISPTLDFLISISVSLTLGLGLTKIFHTDKDLSWM